MSIHISEVNDNNYQSEVLECKIPVLVDFWASWCGPCIMMAPLLDTVAGEYKNRVKVVKVNIDYNTKYAHELKLSSIPSIVAYVNGKVVKNVVGALSLPQLRKLFEELVNN